MANKTETPNYGTVVSNGDVYYRTRMKDAEGKTRILKAKTPEELYEKERKMRDEIEDILFRRDNPTVREYCEKWLTIKEGTLQPATIRDYRNAINNYIVNPLGDMYLSDVRSDDIQLAMIRVSERSAGLYETVNMLFKTIFYSAERSDLIDYNSAAKISPKGGKLKKERVPLTDAQAQVLLDTVKDLPPYVFTMIALYSGLRREEILGLQWDCVFLDVPTPYISAKRAWRSVKNRPEVSTVLKTPAAKRDVPIPKKLVECLRAQKMVSKSDYVIADSEGDPLSYSQFTRIWNYVKVRSTKERFSSRAEQSCVCAKLMELGLNIPFSICLSLLAGCLIGCLNGFLVAFLNLPSFVATYGVNMAVNGICLMVMQGGIIYDLSKNYKWIGIGYLGPLPIPIILSGIMFFSLF